MTAPVTEIYNKLRDHLIETGQIYFVTRWDMVHYCVGYFGCVTADHLTAIACLERNNLIKK